MFPFFLISPALRNYEGLNSYRKTNSDNDEEKVQKDLPVTGFGYTHFIFKCTSPDIKEKFDIKDEDKFIIIESGNLIFSHGPCIVYNLTQNKIIKVNYFLDYFEVDSII